MKFRSTASQRKALTEQRAALPRVRAVIRAQQRGVRLSVLDWLLRYGHHNHDPLGCELVKLWDGPEVERRESPAFEREVAVALSVHAGGGSGGSLVLFHRSLSSNHTVRCWQPPKLHASSSRPVFVPRPGRHPVYWSGTSVVEERLVHHELAGRPIGWKSKPPRLPVRLEDEDTLTPWLLRNSRRRKMPIWRIEPITDLPHVTLDAWTVFAVPLDGENKTWTKHFVGFSREGCQGQVSSPVEQFDPATRSGITRSGRVYQLAGRPGADGDAQYVWEHWKALNSIKSVRNISDEVYGEIQRAAGLASE